MIGAWPELVYSPLRIAQPMVREGYLKQRSASDPSQRGREAFVPVGWDTALDLIAEELMRVRETYGPSAIFGGSYGWSSAGRVHHARTQLRRFLSAGGGYVDQYANYSWGAAQMLLPHVLGDFEAVSEAATAWPAIVENTDLLVAFGGLNPKNWHVTAGGAGQHGMSAWVRKAQERGIEFTIISPLRSDAPDGLKYQWLSPVPGSDTALMLGLAHTLLAENLHDRDFLNRYTSGFEAFSDYLTGSTDGQPKTAEWAASITGLAAEDIRQLARKMAAGRTMLTASWSLQRGDHGEQSYWALIALAAMLGEIDKPGGGFTFGYGSLNGVGAVRRRGLVPVMPPIANPAGQAIPVARIADMLLKPGKAYRCNGRDLTYPDIRLVYWAGGNPFHHHQDLNRFRKAWSRPETIIVHETWWTPTARRADIVLPSTTSAEREDIGGSSRDPYVFYMPQLVNPVGGARDDMAIFRELAARLDCEETFTGGRSSAEWVRHLYDRMELAAAEQGLQAPSFESFTEQGYWDVPPPETDEILLSDFIEKGLPLATPSGRIELYSETIASYSDDDSPPHPAWLPPVEWLGAEQASRFPLHLITNQPANRLHSQLGHTAAGRADEVNGREPVHLNPDDAAIRMIAEGDIVQVFNDRGACLAGAVLDDAVRPGVVIMATGSWYDPVEDGNLKGLDKRGNPNVLTLDKGTSALAQGPSALSALVEVTLYDGEPPPVTVFDLPPVREQS